MSSSNQNSPENNKTDKKPATTPPRPVDKPSQAASGPSNGIKLDLEEMERVVKQAREQCGWLDREANKK
jgi:hypothetical protein